GGSGARRGGPPGLVPEKKTPARALLSRGGPNPGGGPRGFGGGGERAPRGPGYTHRGGPPPPAAPARREAGRGGRRAGRRPAGPTDRPGWGPRAPRFFRRCLSGPGPGMQLDRRRLTRTRTTRCDPRPGGRRSGDAAGPARGGARRDAQTPPRMPIRDPKEEGTRHESDRRSRADPERRAVVPGAPSG